MHAGTRERAFALVELLVVVMVIAIIAFTAVLVVQAVDTKPIDHSCSIEAKHFARAVQAYARKHHEAPGKVSAHAEPSVYSAALSLQSDHVIQGPIALGNYGTDPTQWNYDAHTGVVSPGPECR